MYMMCAFRQLAQATLTARLPSFSRLTWVMVMCAAFVIFAASARVQAEGS